MVFNKKNISTNRGSLLFSNAYENIKCYLNPTTHTDTLITYFDSGSLSRSKCLKLKETGAKDENIFCIMDDPDTWRVDDKREFCRIMKGDKYLPLSFLSFDEFNANKEIYGPDKVWFIKSRGGTGGKSVSCEYSKNITKTPGVNYIFQEEIKPIDLWEDRKYVIRSYILIWNQRAWLHKKALAFVHGKKYEENSSDFNVQVSHNGYWSKSGSVKVQDLELITRIKPRGTHTKLLKLLYESSVNICRKYRNMVSKSTNRKYILLGVDSIPIKKNGGYDIRYVEVNRFPNICHTSDTNRDVNEKVLGDMMSMFLEVKSPVGNDFIPIVY